jgi:AraC family transcriptional regulator of adaptative response / DNA-3-methyladenine glycosylase II
VAVFATDGFENGAAGGSAGRAGDSPRRPTEAAGRSVRFPLANKSHACHHGPVIEDFERSYRAVQAKDARFDGWFFTAVTSTGIYCRPSCPAMTPKRGNVRFYPTAAAAQLAGFRACKRCQPDATPGSPEWNVRADVVGRAMRLIADGVVDREGVRGLAARLGYSERHLHRQLVAEVGAGPIALARAQRAQTARILIETTDLPFAQVTFGAGFASIRQFNDTVREVFATTPSELRRKARTGGRGANPAAPATGGSISLRLPVRQPFDGDGVLGFLGQRAVPGIEEVLSDTYRRTLSLPHGPAIINLTPRPDHVRCTLRLQDLRDLASAVQRARRVMDLDADPVAVAELLGQDELLAPLVAKSPGRRSPGHADGAELALRAVLGQQVSLAGARTHAVRLVMAAGAPLDEPDGDLTHLFPTADMVAELEPAQLAMPDRRNVTVRLLAAGLADGSIVVDPGADRARLDAQLKALPGIGPWTASYIAMRGLGDPDVFLPADLGLRHALEHLGVPGDPRSAAARAEAWRPWRSYALHHLWASRARPPERTQP